MKAIYLSVFYLILALFLLSCKNEDADYEAARAANQKVIDQISHTWQINQFSVDELGEDTLLVDAGSIQFARCEVDRDNLSDCEGGSYQFEDQESVSFGYSVDTPSPVIVGIRPDEYPNSNSPQLDLYGNWSVVEVNQDSLVLESNNRTLRLSKSE